MTPGRAGRAGRLAAGGLALALAGVVARAAWWEPRRLVVRRLELRPAHWPLALDGLRLGVLCDLHTGGPHVRLERVERIVGRMNRQRPDLVVVLGDLCDSQLPLGRSVAPEAVAARLGELRAAGGVFAVLGNHDGAEVGSALETVGIPVLVNRARRAGPRGPWVSGLADRARGGPDLEAALAAVPEHDAVLLLSHNPDVFPRVPERVSLMLSGHLHGGQVDLPGLRRRWIPSRFGERYAGGHVVEGGRHLFVSTGIGSSQLPVRFRVTPEIALLTLRSKG